MADGTGDDRVVDAFAVLGCEVDADDTEVRRAYRARARDSHPDRGGDPDEFARVNAAYEVLRTAELRADLVVRLRAQARRDALRRGPGAASAGGSAAGGSGSGPAAPGGSAHAPPPRPRRDGRLSEEEQDRLLAEFMASHPDVDARAAPPAGAAPRPPGRRRGSRVRRVLVGGAVVVVLLLLAQPLLPQPVQDGLSEVVQVLVP